jgi:formate hydrogenlyase subunit 4
MATPSPLGMVLAVVTFLLKFALLAAVIAVGESSLAKLRMYLVPDFLGVASALAILAVVFTAVMR